MPPPPLQPAFVGIIWHRCWVCHKGSGKHIRDGKASMSLHPKTKLFEDCGVATKGCLLIFFFSQHHCLVFPQSGKCLCLCEYGIAGLKSYVAEQSLITWLLENHNHYLFCKMTPWCWSPYQAPGGSLPQKKVTSWKAKIQSPLSFFLISERSNTTIHSNICSFHLTTSLAIRQVKKWGYTVSSQSASNVVSPPQGILRGLRCTYTLKYTWSLQQIFSFLCTPCVCMCKCVSYYLKIWPVLPVPEPRTSIHSVIKRLVRRMLAWSEPSKQLEFYLFNFITWVIVAQTNSNTRLSHHLLYPVSFHFLDVMLVIQSESNLAH